MYAGVPAMAVVAVSGSGATILIVLVVRVSSLTEPTFGRCDDVLVNIAAEQVMRLSGVHAAFAV
jgi:hypothetical protein